MNKSLIKISIKFGVILSLVQLLFNLIQYFSFTRSSDFFNSTPEWYIITQYVVLLIVLISCFACAHFSYSKKNNHYISFSEAIFIGVLISGVPFILNQIISLFTGSSIFNRSFGFLENLLVIFTPLIFNIIILFIVITFEAQWKIYSKAGKKGWASLIPVYNAIVLLEIIKKPSWWIILLFIPGVNLIFGIMMADQISERFGKDVYFTVGLLLLPFIFYPILGFSKLEYLEELPPKNYF